ncbi:MAG: hypothetical protein HEQ35_17995 [Gloeotrichia echinulata IR180]|nr:hypothetical protein [Gloeotrichia echinulata DEX184]MCM0594515.1 hypothetical protein [Gloeotrichia echinulata DEX184]
MIVADDCGGWGIFRSKNLSNIAGDWGLGTQRPLSASLGTQRPLSASLGYKSDCV